MFLTRLVVGSAICFGFFLAPKLVIADDVVRDIEEVVVTSRRRDESQQEVPLSVTAFNADRIDQIKPTTLRDFDSLAPNVFVGMNAAGPSAGQIFIRGIGTFSSLLVTRA